MNASEIICVFLMSCFTDLIKPPNVCPNGCECFTAPKDLHDMYWNQSKSLICETMPKGDELENLTYINTIALRNEYVLDWDYRYFEKLNINNIVLDGMTSRGIHFSPETILDPKYTFNINGLQVLTLLNLNLTSYNWKAFKNNENLTAIHIENCSLNRLETDNFGSLSATKIISLTILTTLGSDNSYYSKLEEIESDTFKGWNSLRMITINDNLLRNMSWTRTSLPELWYLDLRGNHIESIPDNLSASFPKLRTLKLDNNYIKLLNWDILEPLLTKLQEFSLLNNTLCAEKDVLKVFQNSGLIKGEENTSVQLPYFFKFSLRNLICKDVSHNMEAPTENCSDLNIKSFSDDKYCINFNGTKIM